MRKTQALFRNIYGHIFGFTTAVAFLLNVTTAPACSIIHLNSATHRPSSCLIRKNNLNNEAKFIGSPLVFICTPDYYKFLLSINTDVMSPAPHKSNYAPIVLFAYKRLDHLSQVIRSLQANPEAISSELYIYADAAKSKGDADDVNTVRAFIKEVSGFNAIHSHFFNQNQGLATAITHGVSDVITTHGKVIVLEDDVVVSETFLRYMNQALGKYQHQEKVWHISGWNYPIKTSAITEDTFFLRTMNCWGWGTWADRWQHYEKNPDKLIKTWPQSDINAFNLDNHVNFWSQVKPNANGKLNTWAIFWYSTIFSHQGLCLNPTHALTRNIGHDGSGENCGSIDYYGHQLPSQPIQSWPKHLEENPHAIHAIKQYHRRPSLLLNKLRSKIRHGLSRLIKSQ